MLNINHVRQINDGLNWKCGAACLEMLFSFFGISKSQDKIWDATNSARNTGIEQRCIKTYDLARYACQSGLTATIYKAKQTTWEKLLRALSEREIPAILSLRQPKSGQSHFTVFKGTDGDLYCFCDPDEEEDTTMYGPEELADLWSPQREIDVTGYILICFGEKELEVNCRSCGEKLPITQSWISNYASNIICPHCDGFAI